MSGHDIINIFHDFKVMFIQLNEATNHTVHVSNHGALSTFIVLSETLKGGFIMTYICIYVCTHVSMYVCIYNYTCLCTYLYR